MKLQDFLEELEKENIDYAEHVCPAGTYEGQEGILTRNEHKEKRHFTYKGIEKGSKEDLMAMAKEEPPRVTHVTRIVGYFSQVQAWNKSKKGELKDRVKMEA